MLKADSLFYAMVISILFALLSSSIILYSYVTRFQFDYYLQIQRIQLNAGSGINFLLSDQDILKLNDKKRIPLFDENDSTNLQSDIVSLERKSWGAFEIGISKAIWKKDTSTQIALIGYGMNPENDFAVYLSDRDKSLWLCGKTIIKGLCYLPKAGAERAYIDGKGFLGDKLIDGEIRQSKKILPHLNMALIESLISLFSISEIHLNSHDSIICFDELKKNRNMNNSFEKRTIILLSKNRISLKDDSFEGNIIIVSEKEIEISSGTQLKDIIIIAPKIEIKEGFIGNIQAYANDTLIIEKNCQLKYPSSVGIIRSEKNRNDILLKVEEGTILDGVLLAYQEDNGMKENLKIQLERNTKVMGEVYSSGSVDLQGEVYGRVMCNKFILHTSSSVYENYLLNAVIDNSKMPVNLVTSIIVEQSGNKKVAQWLY